VTLATILTILLVEGSLMSSLIRGEGLMLLATLSALAVLEHWFMVLPLPLEALWCWSLLKSDNVPVLSNAACVVKVVRVAEGAGTRSAFEAWTAPVVGAGDAADESTPRSNVVPHPAISKQRRHS
jgi:hypothetical protein